MRTKGPRAATTAAVRRTFALGATVLGVLGTSARLLADVGLYAIMAFRVTQSTREVGCDSPSGSGGRRWWGCSYGKD